MTSSPQPPPTAVPFVRRILAALALWAALLAPLALLDTCVTGEHLRVALVATAVPGVLLVGLWPLVRRRFRTRLVRLADGRTRLSLAGLHSFGLTICLLMMGFATGLCVSAIRDYEEGWQRRVVASIPLQNRWAPHLKFPTWLPTTEDSGIHLSADYAVARVELFPQNLALLAVYSLSPALLVAAIWHNWLKREPPAATSSPVTHA